MSSKEISSASSYASIAAQPKRAAPSREGKTSAGKKAVLLQSPLEDKTSTKVDAVAQQQLGPTTPFYIPPVVKIPKPSKTQSSQPLYITTDYRSPFATKQDFLQVITLIKSDPATTARYLLRIVYQIAHDQTHAILTIPLEDFIHLMTLPIPKNPPKDAPITEDASVLHSAFPEYTHKMAHRLRGIIDNPYEKCQLSQQPETVIMNLITACRTLQTRIEQDYLWSHFNKNLSDTLYSNRAGLHHLLPAIKQSATAAKPPKHTKKTDAAFHANKMTSNSSPVTRQVQEKVALVEAAPTPTTPDKSPALSSKEATSKEIKMRPATPPDTWEDLFPDK
ncbi:MAG: hypothetical protein FJZ63_00200 [Chlamydiae bacterium]|nr:hypothetical protein [Chlamydiota bacterium]